MPFLRRCCIVALSLLAGGCAATLEDFREMSPHQRADYACNADREIRALQNGKETAASTVSEIEEAIARGYRVHQSCKEVYVPDVRKCKLGEDGVEVCKQSSERRTVCEDLPVAIDGSLEKEKLKEYQNRYNQYLVQHSKKFEACLSHVRQLSSSDAFDYYQRVR